MKSCCNNNCEQGRNCPERRSIPVKPLLEKILRSILHLFFFVLKVICGAASIFLFLCLGMIFYGLAGEFLKFALNGLVG
jgi:hypothetical protein